ncbi:MAG: 4-alpha-glucanotransferase [Candidatus Eremiobacteraeota bacterium]|nr:4-alpha-glucanotransferase [Candidatus Eremiobacteraeota bacterium]
MIEPYYCDYWGTRIETPEPTRRALLAALGAVHDDTAGSTAALVVRKGEQLPREICAEEWSVELEDGSNHTGDLARLPLGYHALRSRDGSLVRSLIVTPQQCYLPPRLRTGKAWALSTQLYALRSQRNWGVGDFTDLAEFAKIAASNGARAVGVNPLHELHPSNPAAASPYSPSSRLFLNVIYIDVQHAAERDDSRATLAEIAESSLQDRIASLRHSELVDYAGVARLKLDILTRLHRRTREKFVARPTTRRAQAFARFCRRGGEPLERLAVYEMIAESFRARNPACYGWLDWPAEYRSPDAPAVAALARKNRERVDFYVYLQWLAQEQLASSAAQARRAGCVLYGDLAVGVERNGAAAWSDQSTVVTDASLGAPPDPLNTYGQNWGLAPLSPRALTESAYRPWTALLRANMRHAGILRVDHVMSLRRAFWIPRGAAATQGAYVRYPLDDMLGILALESLRNRCAVVGEDLGTVPEGFRDRMQSARALSSRLFYFERDWNDASFLPPARYPRLAAASIGTHDLPTLAGWWTGDRSEHEDRWHDRFLFVDALERAGALDASGAARLRADASRGGTLAVIAELASAAHRFLADTSAALVVVAIEDVLNETGAINVPGTVDEHPNWRRKRSLGLENIEADGRLSHTGKTMVGR